MNSSQCAGAGSGAFCKLVTSRGDGTYTNGFCTLPCTGGSGTMMGQGNCPALTQCLNGVQPSVFPNFGEADTLCTPNCVPDGGQGTCRTGYGCYGNPGTAFCWISPLPPFDAGVSDKVGSACTMDSQCQNPPDPIYAFCYPNTLPDGGSSGFQNGYCFSNCTFDNVGAICGANAVCVPFQTFDGCIEKCSGPTMGKCANSAAGCTGSRAGYSCYGATFSDGGTIPGLGLMWPSCDSPGNDCSFYPGGVCNTTNGYCCLPDGGSCANSF